MNWPTQIFTLGAWFITSLASAGECSVPPVGTSEQALCYALAYAEKNGLPHGSPFRRSVVKGRTAWTVRFIDTRSDTRGAGWEVDVDSAAGTATRFVSYKKHER
jgi:hypothetical protein